MTTLANKGEFGLIYQIQKQFSSLVPSGVNGMGDDCAVIPLTQKKSLLVTTDALNEETHFLRKKIAPQALGYKSLAVSLSDIAAMGGVPKYAFLSLSLPHTMSMKWINAFFKGFFALAKKHQVALLGGDTARSQTISIDVTVLGEADPRYIKYRSSAKPGDLICVTGNLGDSGAGLQCLLRRIPQTPLVKQLIHHHCLPRPHLTEGQWLAKHSQVHAMIDISDGIDSDLKRICEESYCGAEIHLDQLPISKMLYTVSQQCHWNAPEIAATGGEDYCLLITLDPDAWNKISRRFKQKFSFPLKVIGKIHPTSYDFKYFLKGKKTILTHKGYQHF